MSGSTFQPPINIDPSQSNAQQASFINQNFQTLASVLETNSLRVILNVPLSVTVDYNSATSSTWFESLPVAHGLQELASYMAFITIPAAVAVSGALPFTNLPNPALVYGIVGSAVTLFSVCVVSVDATNVYLSVQLGPGLSTGTYTITAMAYLFQKLQS